MPAFEGARLERVGLEKIGVVEIEARTSMRLRVKGRVFFELRIGDLKRRQEVGIEESSFVAYGAPRMTANCDLGGRTARLVEEDRLNPHPLCERRRKECGTRPGG